MLHKDQRLSDEFETLCSIPAMTVTRRRFRAEKLVEGLSTSDEEALIIPTAGRVEVAVGHDGQKFLLDAKDTLYLPPGTAFSMRAEGEADVLWALAPATKRVEPYVKRFSEVAPIRSGAPGYTRQIFTSIGEKDPANRFIVGFVEGESGNWTSFPPHRHDGKPELYVYYGMGEKFGIQVVAAEEERAYVVREGDAVLFEKGYHPNVATPGVGMNFVWIISADPSARNLQVQMHPEYKDMQAGQTHLTTK